MLLRVNYQLFLHKKLKISDQQEPDPSFLQNESRSRESKIQILTRKKDNKINDTL